MKGAQSPLPISPFSPGCSQCAMSAAPAPTLCFMGLDLASLCHKNFHRTKPMRPMSHTMVKPYIAGKGLMPSAPSASPHFLWGMHNRCPASSA